MFGCHSPGEIPTAENVRHNFRVTACHRQCCLVHGGTHAPGTLPIVSQSARLVIVACPILHVGPSHTKLVRASDAIPHSCLVWKTDILSTREYGRIREESSLFPLRWATSKSRFLVRMDAVESIYSANSGECAGP